MTVAEEDIGLVLHDKEWQRPKALPDIINTAGVEDSPFIMSDGKNLYFFITPSYGRPPEDQISDGITGIYYSNNKKGEWQEPERVLLDKKTGSSLDGCHFIDENIIWFCSALKGNYGEIDIYTARMENCKWTD